MSLYDDDRERGWVHQVSHEFPWLKWVAGMIFAVIVMCSGIMSTSSIPVGHEGVFISRFPGGEARIYDGYKTGTYFAAPWTSVEIVNMQPLVFDESFDDLMSGNGVPLDFHSSIRVQVTDAKRLITEFGPSWYGNNLANEFANQMRQEVRKHGMNELAIQASAIDEVDSALLEKMRSYVEEIGLPVRVLTVTVGKANPPDAILTQRTETAQQEQRAITEDKRREAENVRFEAETSRAKADLAYRDTFGFSSAEYLRLQEIDTLREACTGEGRCTLIIGGGSASLLLPKPE